MAKKATKKKATSKPSKRKVSVANETSGLERMHFPDRELEPLPPANCRHWLWGVISDVWRLLKSETDPQRRDVAERLMVECNHVRTLLNDAPEHINNPPPLPENTEIVGDGTQDESPEAVAWNTNVDRLLNEIVNRTMRISKMMAQLNMKISVDPPIRDHRGHTSVLWRGFLYPDLPWLKAEILRAIGNRYEVDADEVCQKVWGKRFVEVRTDYQRQQSELNKRGELIVLGLRLRVRKGKILVESKKGF